MSIEKKSLISNRTATKKAIVTKPEVSTVAATRAVAKLRVARVAHLKVARVQVPRAKA